MGKDGGSVGLFETKSTKGRGGYKLFASTVFVGICFIWVYRFTHIPMSDDLAARWAWIGMFMAEIWFGFYWIITQSVRWNIIYRYPCKHSLSLRYEDKLPGVDIFVCTADPKMEPPTLAVNTVLSLMSYNYPTHKLSVYLSDDGGSKFTFYALLEASQFSKHWIPFCKKFKVEPRSPTAYFAHSSHPQDSTFFEQHLAIKKLYEEMKIRIETAIEKGSISKDIKDQHDGFSEWNSKVTKQDHQSIVKILIDGRNPNEVDVDGHQLPTLVYLAREKNPKWPHNFKAGSMNALIRVSSEISNGPIILNLDCDMYANDSDAIRDAMCFFLDEEQGHEISYVQYPQRYENITKNDIYSNDVSAVHKMGLVYGCSVEDIVTGLTIQCRGWKPVFYNPEREAFLGVAPTSLYLALVQYKRWSQGMFQIFFSKYCPFTYGHGKIKLGAQMGYCVYLLWAPCSLPTLYYVVVPSLCLLRGIPLFPQVSSIWFLPFAYVFVARNACSFAESLKCGDTVKSWWNMQRMWVIRRTTSYVFAFVDTIIRQMGFSETSFVITDKVVDEDVVQRYENDILDFGSPSIMFTIIATLALVNLFTLVWGMMNIVEHLIPQMTLCGIIVMLNLPVYQALFLRNDKGNIPSSVMFKSVVVASFTCLFVVCQNRV